MDEAKRVFGATARLAYASSPMDAASGADALVLVTEWQEFRSPDFREMRRVMRQPLLFDGRNLYDPGEVRAAGFEYFGIGRQ
jgi:UDPglucose 6-dehydrogenase